MISMTIAEHLPPNPYCADETNGLFVGRDALFAAIENDLAASLALPVVLHGAPRIGKTAVLGQIARGRLGAAYLPLCIDLRELAVDGLSMFWWELAEAAAAQLAAQGIELGPRQRPQFVAAPYLAFREQFLQPLLAASNGRIPLFLGDNADALLAQLQKEQIIYDDLWHFLHHGRCGSVLVLQQPLAELAPEARDLLADACVHRVAPLEADDAITLMREPAAYTIVNDVAHYIYQLTAGHPARLQQLCRVLNQQQQQQSWQQLTIADVVAAERLLTHNGVRRGANGTAVHAQIPGYVIPPAAPPRGAPPSTETPRRWAPLFGLLALFVVLFIGGGLLLPRLLGDSDDPWLALLAGAEATATPTATATEASAVAAAADATATVTPDPTLPAVIAQLATTVATTPTVTLSPTPTLSGTILPTPTSTPSPTPTLAPQIMREIDNMPMVLIPAGTFTMGSPEDDFFANADERPQHRVTLDAFYMDQFEVNVAQYAAFLNHLGSYFRACDDADCALPRGLAGYTSFLLEEDFGDAVQYVPLTGYANYPANHVSWPGAAAYCEYVGGRLPTEAEWEYAARGTDGRLYPWGNQPPGPNLAVFQSEGIENLKPVDALPEGASPFGVYGMAGSVWEWTADWYAEDAYTQAPRVNPTGPETGLARVIRGGAWPTNNEADRIRTANRSSASPLFYSGAIGFRCVRDAG